MLAERTGSIEQQATKPGGILLLVERDMTICRSSDEWISQAKFDLISERQINNALRTRDVLLER